jgi:hypothetical protein
MTANNPPDPAAPDTIVLIHGLWMTPVAGRRLVGSEPGRDDCICAS